MAAGMRAFLVVSLSTVVLHSVSAGGVYCAKTARARAAALGLDYPGVHGAPDLFGPPHYEMHLQPYNGSDPGLAQPQLNMAYYSPPQPVMGPSDSTVYYQAPPSMFEGYAPYRPPYEPRYSPYTADHAPGLPGGAPAGDRGSAFEEIKHVPPPLLTEAPGWADLVNGDPRNHNQPFVNSNHGPVVYDSAPNRHGATHGGIPQPPSRNHKTYQRGLTGYSQGREVPVLGSFEFIKVQGTIRNRPGSIGRRPRFPSHLAQYLQKNLSVRPFAMGNPILRHLSKPKPGPVRKEW